VIPRFPGRLLRERRTIVNPTPISPTVRIHRHASGESGIFANAYIVETPRGIVAVDATLTETGSRSLRTKIESLGKPLLAVLITGPRRKDEGELPTDKLEFIIGADPMARELAPTGGSHRG